MKMLAIAFGKFKSTVCVLKSASGEHALITICSIGHMQHYVVDAALETGTTRPPT